MTIEDKDFLALKKVSAASVRKLGLPKDPADFAPHKLSWRDLNATGKSIMQEAGCLLEKAEGDIPDQRAADIENAHNALMAFHDAVESEKDARSQIGSRAPRATGMNPRVPTSGGVRVSMAAMEGVGTDGEGSGWIDVRSGQMVDVLGPEQRFADVAAGDCYEGSARNIADIARGVALGGGEQRDLGIVPDASGGFTVPAPLAASFIDKLRAQSVVMGLGGRTVPMSSKSLRIARLDEDPTTNWRAESTQIADSDPSFSAIDFDAKSVTALVKVSRELLEDSANINDILTGAFAQAFSLEMDRVVLAGSGAGEEPQGILGTTGIHVVDMGTDGAALTDYDSFLDAQFELENANVPGPFAAAMHPRTARDIRKLKDSQGNPLLIPETVRDMRRVTSTQMPTDETQGNSSDASSVIVARWPGVMVGLRSEFRLQVLNERYADFGQIAFLGWMRMDVQVEQAKQFARIQGIVPA